MLTKLILIFTSILLTYAASHHVVQHQHTIQHRLELLHKYQMLGMRKVGCASRLIGKGEVKPMDKALGQPIGAIISASFQTLHDADLAGQGHTCTFQCANWY